jgi:hypothetical protein
MLIEMIRVKENYVCWEKEEVRKSEVKAKCKQALVDFYRLQNQF